MSKNWEMVGTVGDLSKSDLPETWEFPQNHSQDSGKSAQNPVNFTSISGQNDLKFSNFVSNLLTISQFLTPCAEIVIFWKTSFFVKTRKLTFSLKKSMTSKGIPGSMVEDWPEHGFSQKYENGQKSLRDHILPVVFTKTRVFEKIGHFVSKLLTKSKIVSKLLTISWFWPSKSWISK